MGYSKDHTDIYFWTSLSSKRNLPQVSLTPATCGERRTKATPLRTTWRRCGTSWGPCTSTCTPTWGGASSTSTAPTRSGTTDPYRRTYLVCVELNAAYFLPTYGALTQPRNLEPRSSSTDEFGMCGIMVGTIDLFNFYVKVKNEEVELLINSLKSSLNNL